jgi:hypothetical protein
MTKDIKEYFIERKKTLENLMEECFYDGIVIKIPKTLSENEIGRKFAYAVELFLKKALKEKVHKISEQISKELVEGSWDVNLKDVLEVEIRNILIEERVRHPQIEAVIRVKKSLQSIRHKVMHILNLYKADEIKVTGSLDAVFKLTQTQKNLLDEIEYILAELEKAVR